MLYLHSEMRLMRDGDSTSARLLQLHSWAALTERYRTCVNAPQQADFRLSITEPLPREPAISMWTAATEIQQLWAVMAHGGRRGGKGLIIWLFITFWIFSAILNIPKINFVIRFLISFTADCISWCLIKTQLMFRHQRWGALLTSGFLWV